MARCGNIVFFTTSELADPIAAVHDRLRYSGAQHVSSSAQTIGPDRSFEEFLNGEDDQETIENFKGYDDLLEAARVYRPNTTTYLVVGRNAIGCDIYEAINQHIPEAVRGDFAPSGPGIRIGWHDVFETSEHDDGYLFGRAFLSFSQFGYGSPLQWQRCRELVFHVPAVAKLKADLEAIVGPMQQCVY